MAVKRERFIQFTKMFQICVKCQNIILLTFTSHKMRFENENEGKIESRLWLIAAQSKLRLSETIKRKTKKQRQQSGAEGWASKTFKPENTQKIQKSGGRWEWEKWVSKHPNLKTFKRYTIKKGNGCQTKKHLNCA